MSEKLKRAAALFCALALLFLAGCGERTPSATPTPAATPEPAGTPAPEQIARELSFADFFKGASFDFPGLRAGMTAEEVKAALGVDCDPFGIYHDIQLIEYADGSFAGTWNDVLEKYPQLRFTIDGLPAAVCVFTRDSGTLEAVSIKLLYGAEQKNYPNDPVSREEFELCLQAAAKYKELEKSLDSAFGLKNKSFLTWSGESVNVRLSQAPYMKPEVKNYEGLGDAAVKLRFQWDVAINYTEPKD